MPDQGEGAVREKPQHERLPSLYGLETCGKPFRILGSTWERYKSNFTYRNERVFAMRKDVTVPASAPGNFLVWSDATKTYVAQPYEDYDFFAVTRQDGTAFRGRLVDSEGVAWDQDNFELDTDEGWKKVDYNTLLDSGATVDHVERVKRVEYVPVSLLAPTQLKDKTVQRVKLELTKTAAEALGTIRGTLEKADADPKRYAYAFTYLEKDKQYVILDDDYRKLTDEEVARAADEEANTATGDIGHLTPAGAAHDPIGYGQDEAMSIDEIPF